MSVAADIILIITAIQSNGNLSYTLNVFKTKHFLKSTQLVTRSEKLVATVLKIYQRSEIAKPTGRAKWYAHTQKEKLMRRQNKCKCEGQNKLRTRRCKWGAHVQVKMRCACAGKNAKPVRRPKCDAHAQLQMRCASAGQKQMHTRRPKRDAHAQD